MRKPALALAVAVTLLAAPSRAASTKPAEAIVATSRVYLGALVPGLPSEVADIVDVVIVGAGAAGLATAIFTRQANPRCAVLLLDSARRPGAKILVSGGSRCNVTNVAVSDADFWGGRRSIVRRIIRAFPVRDTIGFFRDIGVALHEEADGKLFPDTQRARDVLDALLTETGRVGATLAADTRVLDVVRDADGFRIVTNHGDVRAARVVLATGGQSLPKSGSDGAGYGVARRLGHTVVPTTPALVPLLLASDASCSMLPLPPGAPTEAAAISAGVRLFTDMVAAVPPTAL